MKNKNHNKTIHQHVEQALRHRVMLAAVVMVMCMGLASFDSRFREVMRQVYAEGWGFLGVYAHHEQHTAHPHISIGVNRVPTVSGK